jgi:uncharacterized alkaline shock family protein YloU
MASQKVDLGSVAIHKKVLAEIVSTATKDFKGIRIFKGNGFVQFLSFFTFQKFPGIKIKVNSNDEVSVVVMLKVQYGLNIADIASQLQKIIKDALEKSVQVTILDININVQGINRG